MIHNGALLSINIQGLKHQIKTQGILIELNRFFFTMRYCVFYVIVDNNLELYIQLINE